MFSVYLLHICNCTHLMASFERYCVEKVGMSLCIMFSVTAVLTFAVCLMVDLVRRFALLPVRPTMGKVLRKMDAAYVNAIDFIEQKLVADDR
jgi:hypothetical protein